MGLPSDLTWNLNHFRDQGKLIGEVSGLSINKNSKMRRGFLFLPLCKLMHQYAEKVLKLDTLIISTTMEVEYFYTDVLLFEKLIKKTGQENPIANGNKSTCCFLDLKSAPSKYQKVYSNKKDMFNLHKYFFETNLSQTNLNPDKKYLGSKLFEKNKSIAKIMKENLDLYSLFSDQDKLVLANLDNMQVLGINANKSIIHKPKNRVSIYHNSWIFDVKKGNTYYSQLMDTSSSGFQIRIKDEIHKDFDLGENLILIFKHQDQIVTCEAIVRWKKNKRYGCEVMPAYLNNWSSFIENILQEFEFSENRPIKIAS